MPNPTLAALADDLEAGRSTARKLVEDCIARIADPAGEGQRTFIHVDRDAALEAADAMDRLRKAHAAPSSFAGIRNCRSISLTTNTMPCVSRSFT